MGEDSHKWNLTRQELCIFISEAICILFYGLFVEFGDLTNAMSNADEEKEAEAFMQEKYALF